MIAANAAVGRRWANQAAEILGGVAGGLVCLLGVADLAGAHVLAPAPDETMQRALDVTVMATGLLAAAVASRPVRQQLARLAPIDPESPVHALALTLAVVVFGVDAAVISFTDVLAATGSQPGLTLADLVFDEAPFLILAFAGVGLFVRRQMPDACRRLGLVVPAWWQVAVGLAVAGAFLALSVGADALSHAVTPNVARQVDQTTSHVFGALGGPLGVGALALVPGICEDALFRGALQPRLGLIATAMLFTSIHTEYGLSVDTAAVFVLAIGLGLVRKYTNTTTSVTSHVGYNLLVGIGLSGLALDAAALVEVALVALAAFAIWQRRKAAGATP